MVEADLIRLARNKKWDELAAAVNANGHLVGLERTEIASVAYFGDWDNLQGVYGLLDRPEDLEAELHKNAVLKTIAPVGFGMGIARLHHHAAHRHNDSLRVLLGLGFKANEVSASTPGSQKMFTGGGTALGAALVNHNISNAELLLSYGADVGHVDWAGEHPLHVTASKGHFEETKWLLEHGANPNVQNNDGYTPLHSAARRTSSPKTLKLLVEAGGDPTIRAADGLCPIDFAIEKGKKKNIEYLEACT